MPADQVFSDVSAFATVLRELHAQRTNRVNSSRKERVLRSTLTRAERGEVLGKTGGRCHICGGAISTNDWQRTMSWRAALAANMQWRTILRLIPSATITDGITTLRSFSGFLS
jgi:hypothetical protein